MELTLSVWATKDFEYIIGFVLATDLSSKSLYSISLFRQLWSNSGFANFSKVKKIKSCSTFIKQLLCRQYVTETK